MGVKSVLIVDDDKQIREFLKTNLEALDFRVVCANDGMEGTMKAKNESFDLIITDLNMPKKDGIKFAKELSTGADETPIIIITGEYNNYQAQLALLPNATVLKKPFKMEVIKALMVKLLVPKKEEPQAASSNSSAPVSEAKEDEKNVKQASANKVILEPGEFLFKEDDEPDHIYLLLTGKLETVKVKDGNEINIGTVNKGEIVGEMAFLDISNRFASVKAVEPSELMIIPPEKFINVLNGQPKWFKAFIKTLASRLRIASNKLTE